MVDVSVHSYFAVCVVTTVTRQYVLTYTDSLFLLACLLNLLQSPSVHIPKHSDQRLIFIAAKISAFVVDLI